MLRENLGFVSGYRFSDTVNVDIECPFRGRSNSGDTLEKYFYGGGCPGSQFVGGGAGYRGAGGTPNRSGFGDGAFESGDPDQGWEDSGGRQGTGASGECDGVAGADRLSYSCGGWAERRGTVQRVAEDSVADCTGVNSECARDAAFRIYNRA